MAKGKPELHRARILIKETVTRRAWVTVLVDGNTVRAGQAAHPLLGSALLKALGRGVKWVPEKRTHLTGQVKDPGPMDRVDPVARPLAVITLPDGAWDWTAERIAARKRKARK